MGKKIKFFIWVKFLVGILILMVVYSFVAGYIFWNNVRGIEKYATESIEKVKTFSLDDSNSALNHLGTVIIKNQALAAEELVRLYLQDHPNKTGEELINDENFQKVAIQPVGEKGYTTVIKIGPQNMIAHPNKALMGIDLLSMSEKPEMQDWWRVVKPLWENHTDSSGYYQWPEADGTYSDKYMYLAFIEGVKVDGEDLSIAATTYINEFNQPLTEMERKLNNNTKELALEINKARKGLQSSVIKIFIFIFVVIVFFSIVFSKSITNPIRKLTGVARRVASGDLDARADISSRDEIGELALDFNKMTEDLKKSRKDLEKYSKNLEKYNKDLEKEVKKRTRELEEKNERLEKFNSVAVNRELRIKEMKDKINELEKKLTGKTSS